MKRYWQEDKDGLVFSNLPEGSCQQERLEMLYFEGQVERKEDGYYISHDNLVGISSDDAELLALPDENPYQLSVNADGTIGYSDLTYRIDVLQPNGKPFVNPVVRGCFLYLDSETVYRLNRYQYNLICLKNESNNTVPSMSKRELPIYSLTNLAKMHKNAKNTQAKMDSVLSEDNQRIIIPEKLDIEFTEDSNGNVGVNPILLLDNGDTALEQDDANNFDKLFNSKGARSIYTVDQENGKRTKFVCSSAVKSGLAKVQSLNRKRMSIYDAKRYKEQPRELFDDDVFKFKKERLQEDDNRKDEVSYIPQEGQYSDRIIGVSEIKKALYYGNSHKIEWIPQEGFISNIELEHDDSDVEKFQTNNNYIAEANDKGAQKYNNVYFDMCTDDNISDSDFECDKDKLNLKQKSANNMALDIKPNFETPDYKRDWHARNGHLDKSSLCDEITLYEYQKEAVSWMYKIWEEGGTGVLLADDMGLGKTLQTLAFISALKSGLGSSNTNPMLIVGPTALLKNWENEYRKFIKPGVFSDIIRLQGGIMNEFRTGEVTPNGKKKLKFDFMPNTLALTTYETLRDYQFSFAEVKWGIIVADEAQKIKNPTTGVTVAIKAMNYDYAICLSGTPVENSWIDLWSIMDFVQPKHLDTLQNFKEKYISSVKKHVNATSEIEALGQDLKKKLNPLFMRRMKKDNMQGLPTKTVIHCRQEMPDYQYKRYMSVVEAAQHRKLHPLMTIARLRDISLHPDLGTKKVTTFYELEPEKVINQSARLLQTFKILEKVKAKNEKALVFVVSKNMQLILRHLLRNVFNIQVEMPVNGSMNGTARQKIIDKFNQSNGFGVLILSPEAAGVGFTITSANHVIHLSRMWNPAKEDQATDRVYRIGQENDVFVYLPMACLSGNNSFDENLNELLDYKRTLSDRVLFPTADDIADGRRVFDGCMGKYDDNLHNISSELSIEDVDSVTGNVFEDIITNLYEEMNIGMVKKTQLTNDNGVDVIVLYDDAKAGLLIQCKHKDNFTENLGNKGVQEVYAAVNYYKAQSDYKGIEFSTAVVTNAKDFTLAAKKLAADNSVSLIARSDLKELLRKYPVPNIY